MWEEFLLDGWRLDWSRDGGVGKGGIGAGVSWVLCVGGFS